jgi:hypothetical protein
MRQVASVLAVAIAAGILSLPVARAQNESDPSTPPPPGKVQQHQDATPAPRDSTTRRDQSAQAPQSPAVIVPPATGDHSVITPPATGDVKTPVIPPPGTRGGNGDVQPN